MIKGGYVLQPRIVDKSEFLKSTPCTRETFFYLVRKVYFEDFGNIKRGQGIFSYSTIIEDLSWQVGYRKMSYTKAQMKHTMKILTKLSMIRLTKIKRGMLITVCNYDTYQNPKNYVSTNEDTHEDTHESTAKIPTIYNKNKEKEKEKEYYITDTDLKSLNEWDQPLTKDQAKKIETKYSDYGDILESYLFKIANWKGKNKSVYLTLQNWIDKDIQNGVLKVKVTRYANY